MAAGLERSSHGRQYGRQLASARVVPEPTGMASLESTGHAYSECVSNRLADLLDQV